MYKLKPNHNFMVLFISIVISFFIFSCSKKNKLVDPSLLLTKKCSNPPSEASLSSTSSANYHVTFIGTWSKSTHPTHYPSGAHFAPISGAVHSPDVTIWKMGEKASNGFKLAVETGSPTLLQTEITALKSKAQHILGMPVKQSPGITEVLFAATPTHNQLTLVSMFVPSHDWFVGVHNLNLVKNSKWINQIVIDLPVYDAGTENGNTFSTIGTATKPQGNITPLVTPVADTNFGNSGNSPGEPFVGRFIICRK